MSIVVQKYGGSSLADGERVRNVAQRIARAQRDGGQVAAVVSAMGDTTDELIDLAHQVSQHPEPREMDLLLSTGELVSCALVTMALKELGVPAVGLGGAQAGIRTNKAHGKAAIIGIDSARVQRELARGNVVIVAGFQGVTDEMDVTTLGRGASDLTAVALAAALGADRCEVYTDVDGIFTADPRIVPKARKLDELGYEEMLELASHGAKMQPRSIDLAAWYKVPVLVASSLREAAGTLIHEDAEMEVTNKVRGVTYQMGVARITVRGVPDRPGIAAALFEPLAGALISVDTIVQNASAERLTDVSFTVTRVDAAKALQIARDVAERIGASDCVSDERLGNVSIVGTGMENAPGYAAQMFKTLHEAGINIEMITTSQIRITCIVDESRVHDAVRVLHQAFELDQA